MKGERGRRRRRKRKQKRKKKRRSSTADEMGTVLAKLFVDPTTLPGGENCGGNHSIYEHNQPLDPLHCSESGFGFVQVLFLMFAYAYVLFFASNLISDGSELLLLVPSVRDIVGSVVLPILGAVPDGAIVLFSGLGKNAQKQVSVGVGALAGSTIMLLTFPWFLSVLGGRVDLDKHGEPTYTKPKGMSGPWKKMSISGVPSLFKTGVAIGGEIRVTAKIMILTSLTYLIIQGPAFFYERPHSTPTAAQTQHQSKHEHDWAIAGFAASMVAFIGYLIYQVRYANIQDAVDMATRKAIGQKLVTLSGAFAFDLKAIADREIEEDTALLHQNPTRLREFLHGFFVKYDRDKSGTIDHNELGLLLRDLNEELNPTLLMEEMDTDKSGAIDFEEFSEAMTRYITSASENDRRPSGLSASAIVNSDSTDNSEEAEEEDEEEEEEEDVPEDLQHLSPAQQQRAIKLRSLWMMTLGTFLVLLFSDPMVDVLDDIGTRIGVPPFYVAFVLAPLASNASELIAAYNYAQKKTKKTIGISLSTLGGAAIMNNTFCLGIFLLLIFAKQLAWQFSAETISILLIEVIVGFLAHKATHRLIDGILIFLLYPLSLVLVAVLEGPVGLD
eukprot:m.149825 g.149825  ORF g.149825 m.149825 type:complete len:613 (-) comp16163_c6_seq1:309-2147(-)